LSKLLIYQANCPTFNHTIDHLTSVESKLSSLGRRINRLPKNTTFTQCAELLELLTKPPSCSANLFNNAALQNNVSLLATYPTDFGTSGTLTVISFRSYFGAIAVVADDGSAGRPLKPESKYSEAMQISGPRRQHLFGGYRLCAARCVAAAWI
jgi:hypothetical protein